MSPCLTPLLIDISSDRVSLKLTLAFIPLWREWIRPTNLSGQPNFSNIFHRVDLLTVSKAFDKSMKIRYNASFCSLHFSCNCRALKIISTMPRLARKPHCDSGRIPLTIVRTNLFKIILENNFPTIVGRDMPLKLLQSDFEPFSPKDTSIASLQSWGTSFSYTLWMTCSRRSIIFSPPFFRISAVMPVRYNVHTIASWYLLVVSRWHHLLISGEPKLITAAHRALWLFGRKISSFCCLLQIVLFLPSWATIGFVFRAYAFVPLLKNPCMFL